MKHTHEQIAIFDCIENSKNHLIVNAGAGTGKTTTIVEAANRLPYGTSSAFLAFNSSIAKELAKKLPVGMQARTFHSFGLAAIRANIRTKVNNFKLNNIIQDLMGGDYNIFPLKKLVSLVKGSRVKATDRAAIYNLINEYNINFDSDREENMAIESIPAILTMCKTQTYHVDFDDMIWLPLENNYAFPHFDVMFVDEAQDFNEAQREMISKCVNGGRCIIVGDKNQAIYGFRGADSNSISLFRERLETTEREITEFPQRNDMVLCPYNAPLVGAFYDLISQGKSAYILGRDMTKGLINAVHRISKNNNMGVDEFERLFQQDFAYNYQRLIQQKKQNQAMALEDKANCIQIFINKATTVGGIIEEIKRVFDTKDEGEIMLSTIHKAKGLEADNVYILATDRMPHPLSGKEGNNLCYVAITRAKKNLFFCGPRPAII
jgi:DNA helicase-2/ATP-dependent DNA helicase PcrA